MRLVWTDEKHFENGASRKRCYNDIHVICLTCLKHKSKMAADCCIFKFLQRSVDEKHSICFQGENAVSNFPCVVWTELETLYNGLNWNLCFQFK